MLNAPIPDNEPSRLAAVRETGLLDGDSDPRFDRYTRLAAHLFQVPIALVSLVDECRVWYVSRYGFGPRQTPRVDAFCSHAINGDGAFVVEDAAKDERFSDGPLVTGEPRIHFYAGYPLTSPHGYVLGTLCAIDPRPRQFSDRAEAALRDMAEMVSAEIVSQQFAAVDPMTGLPNRRGFSAVAQNALALSARHSGTAALLMIQLEGIDMLDGQCLDATGARSLQVFGRLLTDSMRDSDVTGRLVDDRFAVLLADATMEQGWQCVERFREAIAKHNEHSGDTGRLGFCAGVAVYDPNRHGNIEQLLDEGEQQLYRQKRARPRAGLAVKIGSA